MFCQAPLPPKFIQAARMVGQVGAATRQPTRVGREERAWLGRGGSELQNPRAQQRQECLLVKLMTPTAARRGGGGGVSESWYGALIGPAAGRGRPRLCAEVGEVVLLQGGRGERALESPGTP